MIILADLIDIENNDLRIILNAMTKHPNNLIWRGATTDGQAGHPIIFADVLRKEFATLNGDNGAEAVVKPRKSQTHLHRFDDDRARRDLDTPAEWDAWRENRPHPPR